MITSAPRIDHVKYAIRNIVNEAQALEKNGLKILYLNIGDPCKFDFQPPRHIIDAVHKAMLDGFNGYTHSYGILEARRAIAEDEHRKGKEGITEDDVIVTSGASEAIEIAMTALLSEGENILMPSPGYPLYNAIVGKLGLVENNYMLVEENGWQPDPEDIKKRINKKTKAIVLINPNNPTGSICSLETMKAIIKLAEEHNLVIFSDEIYSKLFFDQPPVSIATLTDKVPVISFDGLSKSYVVPGWRIGWMTFTNRAKMEQLIAAIKRIAEARLCAPGPQQFAVKPALEGDQSHIQDMLVRLQKRFKTINDKLSAIKGFKIVAPKAAFYAMARFDHPNVKDDEVFVKQLLKETGVLVVHGSGFGYDREKGTFRIVFLPPEATLAAAGDKIREFIEKHYS